MFLGIRFPETTYCYDDPDHPERITRTITAPAYVAEDRAMLLALAQVEDVPRCESGEPIEEAWHAEMDGWYDVEEYVCHACTALRGEELPDGTRKQVTHKRLMNVRPASKPPLTPLVFGKNTTAP